MDLEKILKQISGAGTVSIHIIYPEYKEIKIEFRRQDDSAPPRAEEPSTSTTQETHLADYYAKELAGDEKTKNNFGPSEPPSELDMSKYIGSGGDETMERAYWESKATTGVTLDH